MNIQPPNIKSFATIAQGLSRNPLGVFALFLVFNYAMAGFVIFSPLRPEERHPLIWFLVLFPALLIILFGWLISRHSGKLFGPADFKDEKNYVILQQARVAHVAQSNADDEQMSLVAPAPQQGKTLPIEAEPQDANLISGDELELPKPDWKRRDYEFAFFKRIFRQDISSADEISQAYLRTEPTEQADNKISWEAFRIYALIRWTIGGDFKALMQMAESYPRNAKVLEYLAMGYMHFEKFEAAADTFQTAASNAAEQGEQRILLGQAARCYAKAENTNRAQQLINRLKDDFSGSSFVAEIIKEVADLVSDNEISLAALERIADLNPGDTTTLFNLAFTHAERGNHDMALLHYLQIPTHQRSSASWNNLGVELDHWKLPAKAVDAFKEAEAMGETLAVANLVDRLIAAGFLSEAREQCMAAIKGADDPHSNINASLTRLREIPDAENKKLSEIMKKANSAKDFYRRRGRAVSIADAHGIDGLWVGPDCELNVTVNSQTFSATGSYETVSTPGFLSSIIPSWQGDPIRFNHTIELFGTISGHTITGKVRRKSDDANLSTLLGSSDREGACLMILSDDGSELKVMEGPENARRFYSLTRKEATA